MPAFNEAPVIGKVLDDLKKEIKKPARQPAFAEHLLAGNALHSNAGGEKINAQIVVIDDGSSDKTGEIVQNKRTKVLRHVLNRGLGGALGTGLVYAKRKSFDIAVTLDSDGQHDPKDIKKVIKPIIDKKADVVIGTRWKSNKSQIPWDRKIITICSNILTFFLFGIPTTDSQSGFRAFSKKALEKITIKTQGMEVSSELFGEIERNKLRLVEVPIRVIYTSYSRRKGQSNLNSIQILLKLILRIFR